VYKGLLSAAIKSPDSAKTRAKNQYPHVSPPISWRLSKVNANMPKATAALNNRTKLRPFSPLSTDRSALRNLGSAVAEPPATVMATAV
jgi:hypothetical protein